LTKYWLSRSSTPFPPAQFSSFICPNPFLPLPRNPDVPYLQCVRSLPLTSSGLSFAYSLRSTRRPPHSCAGPSLRPPPLLQPPPSLGPSPVALLQGEGRTQLRLQAPLDQRCLKFGPSQHPLSPGHSFRFLSPVGPLDHSPKRLRPSVNLVFNAMRPPPLP